MGGATRRCVHGAEGAETTVRHRSNATQDERNNINSFVCSDYSHCSFVIIVKRTNMWQEALQTINLIAKDGVAELQLNRPSKSNAFNAQLWKDFAEVTSCMNFGGVCSGSSSARARSRWTSNMCTAVCQ